MKKTALLFIVAIFSIAVCRVYGVEQKDKKLTAAQIRHAELVEQANKVVAARADAVANDPLRPIFHIMTPAHWCNDPHGIIFFEGRYHFFLQYKKL